MNRNEYEKETHKPNIGILRTVLNSEYISACYEIPMRSLNNETIYIE